jgi:hypothetical protein
MTIEFFAPPPIKAPIIAKDSGGFVTRAWVGFVTAVYYILTPLQAQAAYQKETPINGFTIQVRDNTGSVMLVPAGTLAAGTIKVPVNAQDAQVLNISSTQIVTTLTVAGASGVTINNGTTTLPVGGGVAYQYFAAENAWYKVR